MLLPSDAGVDLDVERRLEAARFMGPPFPPERLDFYSSMTGPVAAAAMARMNADWHVALSIGDLAGLDAILVAAPLLEDRIHDRLGAGGAGANT